MAAVPGFIISRADCIEPSRSYVDLHNQPTLHGLPGEPGMDGMDGMSSTGVVWIHSFPTRFSVVVLYGFSNSKSRKYVPFCGRSGLPITGS